jgi:hypothetical protein
VVTFNVVFTPGTAARLIPFALSLLEGTGVGVRLVANGCGPEDLALLRRAARADERVSFHSLSALHPVAHGSALNRLFVAFPDDPHFAFADSDVIASGDFMPRLWPLAPGQAAVSAAPPVWAADAETVVPRGWPVLSGRMRTLHDGTAVGGTYMAIYDRAAIEPFWRRAPRGFEVHHWLAVPRDLRASLRERGWSYRVLDTGRLINLQLLLAGFTIENRAAPELHHVGAFSGREPRRRGLTQIVDDSMFRLHLARVRRRAHIQRIDARRSAVGLYLRDAVGAVHAGEPPPAAPRTDSAEVDERLAALVAAIELRHR